MTTVRPTSQRRPDAPGDLETVPARATLARALPHDLSLLVVSGPDRGRSLRMALGRHVVGKAPDCALVLSDPLVSRHHLEVEVSTEQLRFRDLGSRNGCFFEGARFDNLVVGVGAQVLLGETELKVAFTDDAAAHLPESRQDHFGELLGESPAMRRVFTLLERVAKGDSAVLLQGETGTGKDLAAEAIHAASARAAGPFVICDLAGVPRTLLESELFGHVRGSFTSAERDREGAFAQAHGGTLFLDEIGELPGALQARLLHVLEKREVAVPGGAAPIQVDLRLVAATPLRLEEKIRRGEFRHPLQISVAHRPSGHGTGGRRGELRSCAHHRVPLRDGPRHACRDHGRHQCGGRTRHSHP